MLAVDLHGYQELLAADLSAEVTQLQIAGRYDEALPLMKLAVALTENSPILCVFLEELTMLYLDMLNLDEADVTERLLRTVHEAHRSHERGSQFTPFDLDGWIFDEMSRGLEYGMIVRIKELTSQPEFNEKEGIVKGKLRDTGLYMIQVGSKTVPLHRCNFTLQDRIVQLTTPTTKDGFWKFHGTGLDGSSFRLVHLRYANVSLRELQRCFASQLCCHPTTIRLVSQNKVITDTRSLKELCVLPPIREILRNKMSLTASHRGYTCETATLKPTIANPRDPMVGTVVVLHSLIARAHLNGCQGILEADNGSGRWAVQLANGTRVSVKDTNIVQTPEGGGREHRP